MGASGSGLQPMYPSSNPNSSGRSPPPRGKPFAPAVIAALEVSGPPSRILRSEVPPGMHPVEHPHSLASQLITTEPPPRLHTPGRRPLLPGYLRPSTCCYRRSRVGSLLCPRIFHSVGSELQWRTPSSSVLTYLIVPLFFRVVRGPLTSERHVPDITVRLGHPSKNLPVVRSRLSPL